jgi:hypothetical protein
MRMLLEGYCITNWLQNDGCEVGVRRFFGGSHERLKAGCQTSRIWRSGWSGIRISKILTHTFASVKKHNALPVRTGRCKYEEKMCMGRG